MWIRYTESHNVVVPAGTFALNLSALESIQIENASDNRWYIVGYSRGKAFAIWTDSYKAARNQARAQLRQKTHEKNQIQNTLAADAQQLLYDFEDSYRKIKLYSDVIIPKAKEMLTASESAYQAGTIDFLSLIDAQRMLLKYELDYERYLAENAQKLAKIEMLTAKELPTVETEPQTEQK